MKILKTGDIAVGKNYAGMINDAISTNFNGYLKCTVDLPNADNPMKSDICAWFVYMDGSVHGYPDGWLWRNIISSDGKTIKEYNVSPNTDVQKERQNKEGYYPYRICFQIDPNGTGNKYWCRFVGAFRFSKFLCEDLSAVEYVKVLDEFKMASKGDVFNLILNTKKDFLADADSYKIPLARMGFSDSLYRLLSGGGIVNSGDLLELGIGINGGIADEIRKRLYACFH